MFKSFKAAAFLIAALATAQPIWAAPQIIVRRPPRTVIIRPYGYGPGWYGYYDPWYRPAPAYLVPRVPQTGEVKLKTHMKDALVYVDGGYAGVAGKLKDFSLSPGNHNIELRDSSGRMLFNERVQVIRGKTAEIHVD